MSHDFFTECPGQKGKASCPALQGLRTFNLFFSREEPTILPVMPLPCPAGATTHRTILDVDRGLSWGDAVAMRDANVADALAAGVAVDKLVGFHQYTTSKEIGGTGETQCNVCLRNVCMRSVYISCL